MGRFSRKLRGFASRPGVRCGEGGVKEEDGVALGESYGE